MKQRVLKAALRTVNAVLTVATVGMLGAFFVSGIAFGVGAVDWRVPVRMFGGTLIALVGLALWGNHILKPGLEALKGDES
jgi:hypothetical protein